MKINRRTFLCGAGASLALPWLESVADTPSLPKRFVSVFVPNGMHMPDFSLQEAGKLRSLSPTLAPLSAIKHKLSVIKGLHNWPAKPDGAGDHASGTASFLTVAHPKKTDGLGIKNGISIDQVIANHLKSTSSIPSLQLGLEGGGSIGDCDSGYSCAYPRNISWASDTQPLPKLVSPLTVFDYLFSGQDQHATAQQREERRLRQNSVLDYLKVQTAAINKEVGYQDRLKIDEYLSATRETEIKLQAVDESCGLNFATGDYEDVQQHSLMMNDLMVMALRCNHTPVISYMMANGGSQRNYTFLDIEGGHHDISHHQDRDENFRKLSKINHWEIQQFADLIMKLDMVREGEGTLLDQCCIYLSSEISDGNRHNHDDLPVIYAGGLGNTLQAGSHIDATGHSIAEFYIAIANSMNVPLQGFGDVQNKLEQVLI